jgi:GAF domain-containing protein
MADKNPKNHLSGLDPDPQVPSSGGSGEPPTPAQAEHLFQASVELNMAQSYDHILATLRRHTLVGCKAHHIHLHYFDRPWTGDQIPQEAIILARWSQTTAEPFSSPYPLAHYPSLRQLLQPDAPTLIEDLATDPRLGPNLRALYQRFNATSLLIAPLLVSGHRVGFLHVLYPQPTTFPETEVRLLLTLIGQAAVVVQNLRHLALAQSHVQRELAVRAITQRLRQASDMPTLLHTALQELSQLLGASRAIIRLGTQAQLLTQHAWTTQPDPERND